MTQVKVVLEDLVSRFSGAGIISALAEAELVVGHVANWNRGEVASKAFIGAELSEAQLVEIEKIVLRRLTREPLQHILGTAPFRNLVLEVGPGALVPRPETELAAELAIEALRQVPREEPVAVDLGTGTGALALSLATEVRNSVVYAVELSPAAHAIAKVNIEQLGEGRVTLALGDAVDSFPHLDGTVDVVVANPPYLLDDQIPDDIEVSMHEPALALYGGEDGLRDITSFLQTAARLLRGGGTVVMEHGENQGSAVREIATASGFRMTATHRDLLHRDRVLTAVR